MRNLLIRPRRRLLLLAAAALISIGVPTYALAGHGESDVKSYTGCLSLNTGSISLVAEGNAPKAACSSSQVQVHLSGGDMTATRTPAGGGLQGGAENGAASLGLQESYKLPQGCTGDQVPKWNGTNAWTCGADNNAGGDITAVNTPSGSGLEGGAQSGDVTLGLGAGFKLPQACVNGQVAKWNGSIWNCGSDNDTTYDGTDFALSNQGCSPGQVVTAITGAGNLTCAADKDTTYSGANFATSSQDCPASQFANGVNGTGGLKCANPPGPGSVAGYSVGPSARVGANEVTPNSGAAPGSIGSLALPAGTYLVIGSATFVNNAAFLLQNNSRQIRCAFGWLGGLGNPTTDTYVDGGASDSMTAQSVVQLTSNNTVSLNCRSETGPTSQSHVQYTAVTISAIRLDSLN